MKVALAQLNYHIGNFESNIAKVIAAINEAKAQSADLIVFSELSICGYPPRDFLEFSDFIAACDAGIRQIAQECIGIAAIIGAPSKNDSGMGKPLYNSAYFIADGKIASVHHKCLLPTYDIFDEYRYFEPGPECAVVAYKNKRIAITVCEDLWNVGESAIYSRSPMDSLAGQSPDFIVNISASPFSDDHREHRMEAFRENALRHGLPVIFVNHVGAQTELIFDGGSFVMDAGGNLTDELKYFEEELRCVTLGDSSAAPQLQGHTGKIERIHDALVLGVRDYFRKSGLDTAILGVSGGADSAVTLALAARALGKERVRAVLLPSKFSSDHSVDDAKALVETIGCTHDTINIEGVASSVEAALNPYFEGREADVTEENIQARARGLLLMGLANKFGYVLLNTSNKSEAAVGYGTLYGDMAGGLSVLGDVYKTDVYELAHFINRAGESIPMNSITKPPSAELKPNQKDTDSLPEYDILDKILVQYIEQRLGPNEIVAAGYDAKLVARILKLVNTNEYKRYQTPPTLRVSSKAFGMGRRMPIVGKYLS
ncbi:MAG TPA: NAD+ synthase [Flavobacteriales bacterium]|nr:NAD+ synthase [Flavobacteriales bacterium]